MRKKQSPLIYIIFLCNTELETVRAGRGEYWSRQAVIMESLDTAFPILEAVVHVCSSK